MLEASLPVAVGDYAACIGSTGVDSPVIGPPGAVIVPNGAFEAVKGVRTVQITDGLSNTLMVGEKHVPPGSFGAFPLDCGIYDGHNPSCNTRGAGTSFPLAISRDDPG